MSDPNALRDLNLANEMSDPNALRDFKSRRYIPRDFKSRGAKRNPAERSPLKIYYFCHL